jgi:hypothetical protein
MEPTRGFIVLSDDQPPVEIPAYMVGAETIRWPDNTLPETRPGAPVQFIRPDELYERHLLLDVNVHVYTKPRRDPEGLPRWITEEIRRMAREPSA